MKQAQEEEKVYGLAACRRVFERRPADIVRVYVHQALLPRVKELLRYCAAERRAYHVVGDEDLERITKSVHHEGLCLLVRVSAEQSFDALCAELAADHGPRALVYLDGVENPHNVGAILRSCGHFGVSTLLGEAGRLPALSGAAQRVAMGAAESVGVVHVDQALPALTRLRALGFELVATLSAGARSLYDVTLPLRIVWLIGAEGPGLSAAVRSLALSSVTIPGTGDVESLNVSVATAVVLAEHWRQRSLRSREVAAGSLVAAQSPRSVNSLSGAIAGLQANPPKAPSVPRSPRGGGGGRGRSSPGRR